MIFGKELFYTGLSVLVFIGESALAYKSGCSGGYCFVVSESTDEILTQQEAERWCLSNGSQLVEIITPDIQYSLVNFTQNQGLNGATYITNGNRSTGDWMRLSGRSIGNISVKDDQTGPSYAYGYLKSSTYGFDIYALFATFSVGGYICSGVSNCTNGFIINDQCYKVYIESWLSWYDARDRCLDAGGDLASFDFIDSNAGFNDLNDSSMTRTTPYGYWIGFRREWWTWQSSKKDVSYSFWYSTYVTDIGDCLCLSASQLQWIKCDCRQQYPFVCISGTSPINEVTSSVSYSSHNTVSGNYERHTASSTNETVASVTLSTGAKIGIGIGVGVGSLLIIALIVVVVIIIMRRKRDRKDNPSAAPETMKTFESESAYAGVVETSGSDENDTHGYDSIDKPPVVYSDFQILPN